MARTINLTNLKDRTVIEIDYALRRFTDATKDKLHYLILRWMAKMTAVEIHGSWERYVEDRLVAALNHNAEHFIAENNIRGVHRLSAGFASYVIRGGSRYFDFRSTGELINKADQWLGEKGNPFRLISVSDRKYIDTLAAIRNCVVHRSDIAKASYRRNLKSVYEISYPPEPDEFLNAKDNRKNSPARYEPRLYGLAAVIKRGISQA